MMHRAKTIPALTLLALAILISIAIWRLSDLEKAAPAASARSADVFTSQPRSGRAATRRGGIVGQVRSASGAPIAGAAVCALGSVLGRSQDTKQSICAVSASDGSYELVVLDESVRVSATAPRYVPSTYPDALLAGVAYSHIDFTLSLGGLELSGEVVDALGGTVGFAQVRAQYGPGQTMAATTTADDSGHFSLHAPPGIMVMVASADGYAPAHSEWVAPNNTVKLVLTPSGAISGRVLGAVDRAPVADATIAARSLAVGGDEFVLAKSDAEGRFLIRGLSAGGFTLTAEATHWYMRALDPIDVPLGETVKDVVIAMDRAAKVSGTASIADLHAPCAEGYLAVFPDEPASSGTGFPVPAAETVFKADGTFELPAVPAGKYKVKAACRNLRWTSGPRALTVGSADIGDLQYAFGNGKRIRVFVTSADGTPLRETTVNLEKVGSLDTDEFTVVADYTNSEGYCDFLGLADGTYGVWANLKGSTRSAVVLGPEADLATLTLAAPGSSEILVEVSSPTGALDNDVGVYAYLRTTAEEPSDSLAAALPLTAEPSGAGRFRLAPIPSGTYEVFVADKRNSPALASATQDGSTIRVAPFGSATLHAVYGGYTGSVQGTVVDEEGEPASNVWVSATAMDATNALGIAVRSVDGERRVLTDRDGRFAIGGLNPASQFTVRAQQGLDGSDVRIDGVNVASPVRLALPRLGKISGQVIGPDGTALRSFHVSATSTATDSVRNRTWIDENGNWMIEHVVPGHVELTAESMRGEVGRFQAELAPGQWLQNATIVLAQQDTTQDGLPSDPHL